MLTKTTFLWLVGFFFLPVLLHAEVKLPAVFCNHMVLQRGVNIPIWGTASPGENIAISFRNFNIKIKVRESGEWLVNLPVQKAGGPYKLQVSGENIITLEDVYVGDVWFCSGQSNMDMTVGKENRYWCGVTNEEIEIANANYPLIRVFDADFTPSHNLKNDVVGKWEICSPQTVGHFSAVAYFFAREIHTKYKIPIGIISSAYGASAAETWISKEALEAQPNLKPLLEAYTAKWEKFVADSAVSMTKYRDEMLKYQDDLTTLQAAAGDATAKKPKAPRNPNPSLDQHNPYVCYNGMIHGLIPYAIKGALWYQGESNGPSANLYREIMETLISDWRKHWGCGNFPFYYVQLANYGKPMTKPVEDGAMMTIREAQVQNLSVKNTGMVVAIENAGNDPTNIHPKNKQDIGYRLALIARANTYDEKIVYSGPIYKSYKIKNNTFVLSFDHVGKGLMAKDGKLTGFAICGEDKKWVWAEAKIVGKKVEVFSPEINKPVAVRYCWGTNPPASLLNKNGLWTPNFRTDNF